MAINLKELRKVAVIGWDSDGEGAHVIVGRQASIQVGDEEKRTVDNDGESNLFFPMDYEGHVEVTIEGSKSGRVQGTIAVV